MQNKLKYFLTVISTASVITLSFAGCAQSARYYNGNGQAGTELGPNQGYAGQNIIATNPQTNNNSLTGNNMALNRAGTSVTDRQRAAYIKSVLDNEIQQSSTVAVSGNTCLVGLSSGNTAPAVNSLRDWISIRVKQLDPRINAVAVSDAPDFRNEVTRLSSDINRPANDINNDFNRLLQSVTPLVR